MKRAEIAQLTGIRGVAACLVLFWHLREISDTKILHFWVFDPLPSFGYLGVDVFFLLSGYILSYAYGAWFADRISIEKVYRFFLARAARLEPLHLFALMLMVLAWYVGHRYFHFTPNNDSSYSFTAIVANIFLVHEWFRLGSPNPVSWSISVELASYLLFPFAVLTSSRLPRWWPALALVVIYALLQLTDTRVERGVCEFFFGFSAYALVNNYRMLRLPEWLTTAALLAPFIIFYYAGREYIAVLVPLFCLAVVGIAKNDDWLCRFARTRPIRYLGEISYSLYMMQWFTWVIYKRALPRLFPWMADHPYALITLAAITIIAISGVTYRIIEVPGRRWLVRIGTPHPKPATAGNEPKP